MSGRLDGIRWSVCKLKFNRSLCLSFSRKGAGLCIYHTLVWSNLYFLHISQWITLPTQLCLALYSFYANLLHSLIMWLIVLSLLPYYYYYYYQYYYLHKVAIVFFNTFLSEQDSHFVLDISSLCIFSGSIIA